MKRRPATKKINTVQIFGNNIFRGQKLTIGMDLGDCWSSYCVLDEAGKILLTAENGTPRLASSYLGGPDKTPAVYCHSEESR
jgi:hypothetical protein